MVVCWTYDQQFVGSTPSQVAIKWLLIELNDSVDR